MTEQGTPRLAAFEAKDLRRESDEVMVEWAEAKCRICHNEEESGYNPSDDAVDNLVGVLLAKGWRKAEMGFVCGTCLRKLAPDKIWVVLIETKHCEANSRLYLSFAEALGYAQQIIRDDMEHWKFPTPEIDTLCAKMAAGATLVHGLSKTCVQWGEGSYCRLEEATVH